MRILIDKFLAATGTIALHAGLIWLLLVGVRWERPPPDRSMTTLKGVVVIDDAFAEYTPPVSVDPEPPAPAEPDTGPTPAEVQAQQEAQRLREEEAQRQQEAERQAQQREREAALEQQQQADAAREQQLAEEAERQRQQQEAERQREAEAEAERQRQAQAEQEREAARRREEAERERREAEAEQRRQEQRERARREALEAQLQAELAAEEAREGAIRDGALARYIELIRQKVERNWNRPAGVPDGLRCEVSVRQLRNGEVVSVRVGECTGGEALIRSIEAAVLKASPLPPPEDASIFEPNLRFPFKTGE